MVGATSHEELLATGIAFDVASPFRVLVTALVAGADFLIPWTPSPLAWLTVGAIATTLISLVVRRPLRMVAAEAWLVPVVLLVGGLVDTRALHVVPVPNPLDGYARGSRAAPDGGASSRPAFDQLRKASEPGHAPTLAERRQGGDDPLELCGGGPRQVSREPQHTAVGAIGTDGVVVVEPPRSDGRVPGVAAVIADPVDGHRCGRR
ncbi:MAG TPA: hypothetical protein VFZ70_07390 [Euzebyales bacterium]